MLFLKRIKKRLAKCGELFTIGSNSYYGIFKLLDSGTMRTYLNDTDTLGITHPALVLITHGDVTINVSDTITRDGRTYAVEKTSSHRIGSEIVVKVALLN